MAGLSGPFSAGRMESASSPFGWAVHILTQFLAYLAQLHS